MLKKISLLWIALGCAFTGQLLAADLTIYTYDSFNSKWGPGPIVFKRFEE